MKHWIKIKPEDVKVYLHPAQVEALRRFGDPLPAIIKDITAVIRAKSGRSVADVEMIPAEYKSAACHLVIEALQSRIPMMRLTADQVRNANNARLFLKPSPLFAMKAGKGSLTAKYRGL